MHYVIRKSKMDDLDEVIEAHKRSILELCSRDYTEEQVNRWSDVNYSLQVWARSVLHEFHWVVEVEGKVEGFCHAQIHEDGRGEIAGLYFTRKIAGHGIGREILERAMDYIKSSGALEISITATISAKGFYEKMGFVEIEEKNVDVRGVSLVCFTMVMSV